MELIKRFCGWICHFSIDKSLPDIGGTTIFKMSTTLLSWGVHTMSDELILQISCNIFMAFKWILMMTSGQNISHYTTAKLSVHVWNHDLVWRQNKTDTQKHFRKTTITSSWTLCKTKIPITIVKTQMPSNPNQKSRTRDNDTARSVHIRSVSLLTYLVKQFPASVKKNRVLLDWVSVVIVPLSNE